MEMRDTYTRDGVFTGRVIEKHAALLAGEYLLHAIILMKTRDGRYVLQQRSLKARHFPGEWDLTGGGVQHGETSSQAAAREAMEELGVLAENPKFVHREVDDWEGGNGLIIDIYAARVDVPEGGFDLASGEVEDVRLVSYEEFVKIVTLKRNESFKAAFAMADKMI